MENSLTFNEKTDGFVATLSIYGQKPYNYIWFFGHGPTRIAARDEMMKDLVERKKVFSDQIADMLWKIELIKDTMAAIEEWQRGYQGETESMVTPRKAPEFVEMKLEANQ